ncbi:hypothetical protein IHE44_0015207, partial [Lamprotornis superbus]
MHLRLLPAPGPGALLCQAALSGSDDAGRGVQPLVPLYPERRLRAERAHQVQAVLPLEPRAAALHHGRPRHRQ